MRNFIKYNSPSILWAAFILVICLMPGRNVPVVRILHFDKVVHVSIYIVFAVVTYYGWKRQITCRALHGHAALKIIILLALYGLAVEVMQETLTTDRHFDLYDALANGIGAVIGAFAGKAIFR